MSCEITTLYKLLKEIQQTHATIITKIDAMDDKIDKLYKSSKKRMVIKEKPIKPTMINTINIKDILYCIPAMEHITIVFFSSLEFAFTILLLETICNLQKIPSHSTKTIYEELEFCDNRCPIDVSTQLLRIRGWFDDNSGYKTAIPFKKTHNSLLGYYDGQWSSASYKHKLMRLYEVFCIKIIKLFGEWQDKYKNEIERNKLPNNLDYSECVLKIMGNTTDDYQNISKSIGHVYEYLGQIC